VRRRLHDPWSGCSPLKPWPGVRRQLLIPVPPLTSARVGHGFWVELTGLLVLLVFLVLVQVWCLALQRKTSQCTPGSTLSMIEALEAIGNRFLKRWLGLARSATTDILYLKVENHGLELHSIVTLFEHLQAIKFLLL
jgi:hypothetical protein